MGLDLRTSPWLRPWLSTLWLHLNVWRFPLVSSEPLTNSITPLHSLNLSQSPHLKTLTRVPFSLSFTRSPRFTFAKDVSHSTRLFLISRFIRQQNMMRLRNPQSYYITPWTKPRLPNYTQPNLLPNKRTTITKIENKLHCIKLTNHYVKCVILYSRV